MTTIYIRDVRSMKSAPLKDEQKFKDDHPNGKFVYFDAETGALMAPPSPKVKKKKPDVVEVKDDVTEVKEGD